MIIGHFHSYYEANGGCHAYEELELYKCSDLYFYPEDRQFLGVIFSLPADDTKWNCSFIDVPSVVTTDTDCGRDSYPNDTVKCYYTAFDKNLANGGLNFVSATTTVVGNLAEGHRGGKLKLLPGVYNINESIFMAEGVEVDARGATILYNTNSNTIKAAIFGADDSVWNDGLIINKSSESVPAGFSTRGGVARNTIQNAEFRNFYYGIYVDGRKNMIWNCDIVDTMAGGARITQTIIAHKDLIYDDSYLYLEGTIKDSSLQGWYQFCNAKDSSIYGRDGTLVGNATIVNDALVLDGTGDNLNVGANYNYTKEDFSICLWAYHDVSSGDVLFYKGALNTKGYYLEVRNTNIIKFYTNQSGAYQSTNTTTTMALNEWHHIAVVRAGALVKIYLDGNECTYAVVGTHKDPRTSTDNAEIGGYGGGEGYDWDGKITEVKIYNRALAAYEIQRIYKEYNWIRY